MRIRSAQIAVANAGQAACAVIGIKHFPIRAVLRRGNANGGKQSARVIEELRGTTHRVGNPVQTAGELVTADIIIGRNIACRVRRRLQPGKTRLHDIEAHTVVHLVEDEDLRAVRAERHLQSHALEILIRLRAGPVEEVLRAVAVLPDQVIVVVQREHRDLLMRVGLPAEAAAVRIRGGKAAVVIVADGNRIAAAAHRGVAVRQNHVAVEQVGIHRARAACARLLVLPPALDTGVRNVIDVDHRRILRGSVGGIQLGIVRAGRVIRGTERHAVVVADAVFIAGAPFAVQVRQVEIEAAAARALYAVEGFAGNVARVGIGNEIVPVHRLRFPRLQDFIRADVFRRAGRPDRHLQHRLNHRVARLRNGENVELQQRDVVIAGLDAELQIRIRIGMRRAALADGRVLNGQRRASGMHHRVDGHGIGRVRHEQRIDAVFHANVFARVGKDDLRERLFAFRVVYQRRVHLERDRAGLRVLYQQLRRIGRFVVKRLRQANRRAGKRFRIGKDNILLYAVARERVAHGYAGQHVFIGVFRLQLGDIAALFLSGFDFRGKIRGFETFHRPADELRHALRPFQQTLLLQLRAGAGDGAYGLRLLFEAPRERAAVFGDGRHAAAVRLLREFHPHTPRAIAEHAAALRRDCRFERVVDFLPMTFRIAEVNGLGINHRLTAIRAEIEMLDVFVAQSNLFRAGRILIQPLHPRLHLRFQRARAILLLENFVHSFSPFLIVFLIVSRRCFVRRDGRESVPESAAVRHTVQLVLDLFDPALDVVAQPVNGLLIAVFALLVFLQHPEKQINVQSRPDALTDAQLEDFADAFFHEKPSFPLISGS